MTSGITYGGTVYLPKTGQTACYDENGAERTCAGTGEDADVTAGIGWLNPRFTDNLDGTVTDNTTNLVWLKDANCIQSQYASFDADESGGDGLVFWDHAFSFVAGVNNGDYPGCGAGKTDWRLPNINELLSLHDFSSTSPAVTPGNPFTNMGGAWHYWSSTSAAGNGAWAVHMFFGLPISFAKTSWAGYVWPVRGLSNGPVKLPKTGQTSCFDMSGNIINCLHTGQDGETRVGISWPGQRFTVNGDGTISDGLTQLTWLRDANCAFTVGYDPDGTGDGSVTWQHALDFAKGVNNGTDSGCSAGHTDWRIPNVIEMISLVSPNDSDVKAWLTGIGFINIQDGLHWSSSSGSGNPLSDHPDYAYAMYANNGNWPWDPKINSNHFWLVRGGLFPNLSWTPLSYRFGYVVVGTTSPDITFTVGNTGAADLEITAMSILDTGSGISLRPGAMDPCPDTMPMTLAANSTCTVVGSFSPTAPGAINTVLRTISSRPDAPVLDIPVSGTGVLDTYPQVTLLSPNGGEVLATGSPHIIRWGGPSGLHYSLKYSADNGTTWQKIESGLAGTSHTWTPPVSTNNLHKCLVRVTGYTANGYKAGSSRSKKPFSIEIVKLRSPNGLETFTSNTTPTVVWTTNVTKKPVEKAKAFYTVNGGAIWKPIATLSGNPGMVDWTIPPVATKKTRCKVKVVLRDKNGSTIGSDVSDAYLTTSPP